MRDRTDVVHENVGGDGLEVEEYPVDDETEEHGCICLQHLAPVHH